MATWMPRSNRSPFLSTRSTSPTNRSSSPGVTGRRKARVANFWRTSRATSRRLSGVGLRKMIFRCDSGRLSGRLYIGPTTSIHSMARLRSRRRGLGFSGWYSSLVNAAANRPTGILIRSFASKTAGSSCSPFTSNDRAGLPSMRNSSFGKSLPACWPKARARRMILARFGEGVVDAHLIVGGHQPEARLPLDVAGVGPGDRLGLEPAGRPPGLVVGEDRHGRRSTRRRRGTSPSGAAAA